MVHLHRATTPTPASPERHTVFHKRPPRGFSLVEILVVVAIVGILSAIVVPRYLNSKKEAYYNTAVLDGQAIALEVTERLNTYTSFGSSPSGFTKVPTGGTGIGEMTITLGIGYTPDTSPASQTGKVSLSDGSVLTGALQANGTGWCIKVTNSGEAAVYTENGLQAGSTTCTSSGVGNPAAPWG